METSGVAPGKVAPYSYFKGGKSLISKSDFQRRITCVLQGESVLSSPGLEQKRNRALTAVPGEPEIDISVILPVYEEEENLPILFERLMPILDGLGVRFEVIAVN